MLSPTTPSPQVSAIHLPIPLICVTDPIATYHQSQQSPIQLLDLPTELLEIIAKELGSTYHFRALARLNVCNHLLRDITLSILWKGVRWTKNTWKNTAKDLRLSQKVPEHWGFIE
jgi:hypothetical protein